MKGRLKYVQAAILIGLGWTTVSGAARAAENTALHHSVLRKACAEHGGRFQESWIYNDQGVQWGKVLSCATSAGYVSCQGNFCRGSRWARGQGATAQNGGPDNKDRVMQFTTDPADFSAALIALSKN
ncbi:MAG: hypothetical protein MJE12_01090 [Alphaproteobacteria bacterium]|nr:hypothetical protein [Alphaproteobacteria bacterium]